MCVNTIYVMFDRERSMLTIKGVCSALFADADLKDESDGRD